MPPTAANRTAAKPTGTVQVTARPAASATPVRPAQPTGAATVTDALAYARREVEQVQASQNAQNVSVLATPDQLAGEQTATRLANSLPVRLSKAVLKIGWRAAANNNFAAVGGPDQANLAQLDQAVDEYANQAAMEVQLLDSNNPKIFQQVAPTHSWYGQDFAGSRIWYDNPDTIYRFVGVNTVSSYVITGKFSGRPAGGHQLQRPDRIERRRPPTTSTARTSC